MPGPFRSTDAVLTIAQINDTRSIQVTAANEVARDVFGFKDEELTGRNFKELVPTKITSLLEDYVEFAPGANDVGDVLRKVRDFQLLNKEGKANPFRLKVVRHNSVDHDEFLLIMQDAAQRHKADSFFEMLRNQCEGHASLHPDTGLLDRSTFLKSLELVSFHLDTFEQGVCVVIVEMDSLKQLLAKYGIQACNKVIQNVAGLCQQNLRGKDIVAQVGRDQLGLILLGAGQEPAKMVLNRLRWLISGLQTRTRQGVDVQTTASIVFHQLQTGEEVTAVLEKCEKMLADKPDNNTNIVVVA